MHPQYLTFKVFSCRNARHQLLASTAAIFQALIYVAATTQKNEFREKRSTYQDEMELCYPPSWNFYVKVRRESSAGWVDFVRSGSTWGRT